MIERILKMLDQFLLSNQTLKLNETFKVYLKVLSINHMNFKKTMNQRIYPKRTKTFYKKHYGARVRPTKKYNFFWALDVPDSFPSEPIQNVFKNKCLISATILGLLQNEYYKSERTDTRFLHLQNINSVCRRKKNHAGNLLVKEIDDLLLKTNLPKQGPYELESFTETMHNIYKCQFFIFSGIDNSNQLKYMFPPVYDDSLKPIFLYEPNENPNHIVFIRNLNSYFKGNVKICFACKKTFLTYNYKHFCKEKKSCFSCRRFFSSNATYLHEKLSHTFCDGNLTTETSFTCSLCNVTCYSKHCFNGHKLICTGQGTFGFKCLKCKKFTYRYGNVNGTNLKFSHKCGEKKKCNSCQKELENDHLCPLIKESWTNIKNTKIAFIGMEHFDSSSQNCLECFSLGQSNSKDLFCTLHQNVTFENDLDPCLIVIYQAIDNMFTKYIISCFGNEPVISIESNFLSTSFDCSDNDITLNNKRKRKSDNFKRNWTKLHDQNPFLLMDKFLQLITSEKWVNTTFICQDSDTRTYMAILRSFVKNGFCPVIVRNGRKILVLEIKSLNLRFITSNSYFEGNEYELANQYNLSFTQHFFPKQFLLPQNLNYVGEVPDFIYFASISDNSKDKFKKKEFVELFQTLKCRWNLQKELLTYCEQKLLLLTLACLKFLEDSYLFQKQLHSKCNLTNFVFLNPFSYPLCSLGGYVYKLFKLYYLNTENIFAVQNEYGIGTKNVSKIEYEWASFMDFQFPDKHFQFAFNNKNGQKTFKEAIPDLYSPITKQAYFFNGCIFHGHFENCLINPNATENSKNPFGKTFKELNSHFDEKMTNLLCNNVNAVDEVIIQWECIYKNNREHTVIQNFKKLYEGHFLILMPCDGQKKFIPMKICIFLM